MAERFGIKGLSVGKCLNSFTNLVHGAFIGITSHAGREKVYLGRRPRKSLCAWDGDHFCDPYRCGSEVQEVAFHKALHSVDGCRDRAFCGLSVERSRKPAVQHLLCMGFHSAVLRRRGFSCRKAGASKTAIYSVMLADMAIINFMNMIEINQFLKKL